jgi:hypothetical protein
MAPPSLPWPPDEEIVKMAGTVTSKADLARLIGVRSSSLSMKLQREPDLQAKVNAALGQVELEPETGPSTEEVQAEQIRDLKRQLRQTRKADVLTERVAAAVTDAIERRGVPDFRDRPRRPSASSSEHRFQLLWSDTHFGEIVKAEETSGLNAYDSQVCWDRHWQMLDRIDSYLEHRPYPIETIHVSMLGDMLSGSIHEELAETNEMPLAETSVEFAERGSEWLEALAQRIPDIRVCGIVGNHPRFSGRPRAKSGFDNADWMTYHHMRSVLRKHPGITWDIPKANQHVTRIFDWNALLFHGDAIRSSMPGVPWGGVMRRATTLYSTYAQAGTEIDLYACGHFHQRAIVNGPGGSKIALNGSPKGPDEYSLKQFGGGERPGQLLLTWHRERGITDASWIDLD